MTGKDELPNTILLPQEQQIGLEFALYYEAYATFHELRGNCAAADAVFQDGIKRCVCVCLCEPLPAKKAVEDEEDGMRSFELEASTRCLLPDCRLSEVSATQAKYLHEQLMQEKCSCIACLLLHALYHDP